MSELTPEDLKRIMWIGEQSRSIANHQSGMRLTITGLNFAAMGALLTYSSKVSSNANSIANLLIYSGFIFCILALKMSTAHAFAWGVYEKCRDAALPDDADFKSSYQFVKNDYECKFEINCIWPFSWVTKSKHYIFWPLVNFLIPALPAIVIYYSEWSTN